MTANYGHNMTFAVREQGPIRNSCRKENARTLKKARALETSRAGMSRH